MKQVHELLKEQLKVLDKAVATMRELDAKAKPNIEVPDLVAISLEKERRRVQELEKAREGQLQDFDRQIERARARIAGLERELAGSDAGGKDDRINKVVKDSPATPKSPARKATKTALTKTTSKRKRAPAKRRSGTARK